MAELSAELSTATDDIFLGRLVKPFGIKGDLKFVGSDDFWDSVLASKELYLQREVDGEWVTEPMSIRHARPHGLHYVITLNGVNDRNGAEEMVGAEVYVDLERLDVDMPDYELPFQVLGSTVRLETGDELGEVTSVMFSAAHRVYEVTGAKGKLLIPVVDEFIVDRDETTGVITVRPIPGLLDE